MQAEATPVNLDPKSVEFLNRITDEERVRANRLPGVRTILIVLSASAMVFDIEALRHKLLVSYPEAAVFFSDTMGHALGSTSPAHVDLLIDFTAPDHRQNCFIPLRLRRKARVAIGRKAGWIRSRMYDRVFDEFGKNANVPSEKLARERFVQKRLLGMGGVVFTHSGETPNDLSQSISH